MKNFFKTLLLIIVVSYLQCFTNPAYPISPESDVIKIGCILNLTGKYEMIGINALKGVITAIDNLWPDFSYEILVHDIGKDNKNLRDIIKNMVLVDKVLFIVGPIPITDDSDIANVINGLKVPTVIFPITDKDSLKSKYLIKYIYPIENQVKELVEYSRFRMGIRRFGVLYPNTPLGNFFKNSFLSSVNRLGGQIVYEGSYDPLIRDMSVETEWIKSIEPEAVFIPDTASNSAEIIIKIKGERNISNILFLGPNTWNSNSFLKNAGDLFDGVIFKTIFSDFFYPGSERWLKFYRNYYNLFAIEAGHIEFQVYEAVRILLSTLIDSDEISGDVILERIKMVDDNSAYQIESDKTGGISIIPGSFLLTIKNNRFIKLK